MPGVTRYAKSRDWRIAYQVVGDGPFDLVFVPGFVWSSELVWEEPRAARFFERLASFSRLILFDKREQGMSDRLGRVPMLEESLDDVRAVMQAAGSERAAVFGISEGGPMSALFAATHPELVERLVLYGTYARMRRAPDYPAGVPDELLDAWVQVLEEEWGGPVGMPFFNPSLEDDERFREWWARFVRSGGSPRVAGGLIDLYRGIDIRHALGSITAPTLVLHRRDDPLVPLAGGHELHRGIPGARLVELEGHDHFVIAGEYDVLLDEIEEFLTGAPPHPQSDRVLATVLFTDIVASTAHAAELGDRRWRELLESHNTLVRRELARHGGTEVKTVGDGFFATFDGPGRAVRCAVRVCDEARRLGLELRAGLHTGECEHMNGDVGGIAVHIGARVAALADAGEVVVSSTVKDLVVGSELGFADRGTHALRGVPGEWRLYSVER